MNPNLRSSRLNYRQATFPKPGNAGSTNTNCPLCATTATEFLEQIPSSNIIHAFNKVFKIDLALEFESFEEIEYRRCSECDLRYFYPMVSGSEQFYEKLQKFEWYYMNEKNEYIFARKFIQPSFNVLEIGCGKGAFAKIIKARSYLGLEFSKNAQNFASANGVEVSSESIQDHSINNAGGYDVACSFQVLEHVVEVRSFIQAAVDCLKPGGLLILSTPSVDSFAAYVPNFILDMPPHHVTRWSDITYKNLANIFNLELVEIWHEPLQEIHREFYVQTMLTNSVMKLFRKKNYVWDDSIAQKFVSLVCRLPSKLYSKVLFESSILPRGISVTAVFRKHVGG